jgi:hypothetical protein
MLHAGTPSLAPSRATPYLLIPARFLLRPQFLPRRYAALRVNSNPPRFPLGHSRSVRTGNLHNAPRLEGRWYPLSDAPEAQTCLR